MLEGTLAWKYSNNLVFHSLSRTFELRSKALSLGNSQINLVFHSLIRTFELRSKALSLGNSQINLVFHSLIRTFVTDTVNSISFYNII